MCVECPPLLRAFAIRSPKVHSGMSAASAMPDIKSESFNQVQRGVDNICGKLSIDICRYPVQYKLSTMEMLTTERSRRLASGVSVQKVHRTADQLGIVPA